MIGLRSKEVSLQSILASSNNLLLDTVTILRSSGCLDFDGLGPNKNNTHILKQVRQ